MVDVGAVADPWSHWTMASFHDESSSVYAIYDLIVHHFPKGQVN
jgi:hypothetical protein